MSGKTEEHKKISPALVANLALTKREVTIPSKYGILLLAVKDYHGVCTKVENLLQEYFHPIRNLDIVAKHLRVVCGGNMFHYYDISEHNVRCAELFVDLFNGLYEANPDNELLGNIFRASLDFMLALKESPNSNKYIGCLNKVLSILTSTLSSKARVFLPYSNFIRNTGKRFLESTALAKEFGKLYKEIVIQGGKVFKDSVKLFNWIENKAPELKGLYTEQFIKLNDKNMSKYLYEVEQEDDVVKLLDNLNLDDLINYMLEAINKIENPVHRIEFFIYMAGINDFRYRDQDILRGLHTSIKKVCVENCEEEILITIDLVTGYLKVSIAEQKHALFRSVERLGSDIARQNNPRLTNYFIDKIIDAGFEKPDVGGVSEEWQVEINPHHLECVRAWLSIIEDNPAAYERLLSALIVNLYYYSIFISDTDLFQRDVSKILNSDIADSFNLILQLVTFLPVFFNEIGSEGELRAVSTKVDQIVQRRDAVVHFLRKQSHAESNNRLIGFSKNILRYWRDGERKVLKQYLPQSLYDSLSEDSPFFKNANHIFSELKTKMGLDEKDLHTIPYDIFSEHLEDVKGVPEEEKERFFLMVKFHRLLEEKYSYSPDQLAQLVSNFNMVPKETRSKFIDACKNETPLNIVRTGNRLLFELKKIIVDKKETKATENIYLKRHIAAGIPSMYGSYREPKFDSMGMMIRVMTYLKSHLEEVIARFNFNYITRESMREAYEIMQEMINGLNICGLPVEDLSTKVELLNRSISVGNFSAGQYLNIFEFISRAVSDIVESNYIAMHNNNLNAITKQVLQSEGREGKKAEQKVIEMSEEFLRSMIAYTYSIQEFDLFVTKILRSLRSVTEILDDQSTNIILNYSPDKLISYIHEPLKEHENQLYLGFKGYGLKKLKSLSLPIPHGFVISTELFNIMPAMSYADLRRDTRDRILPALHTIEKLSGTELGNPENLLLLSVRSGAAFSMPGMMGTILNVGMNDEITTALSKKPNQNWTSWDCYRRFLQNYAMSSGVNRDVFDTVMVKYKEKYKVTKKLQFSPSQMKEMAYEYKATAIDHGVKIIENPVDQLLKSIFLVLNSWHSEPAKVYRKQMQLSDDWGTGVIVQKMVLGNRNYDSGTGVIFTRDPRTHTSDVKLFGDFVMCSQGEDVVGGLVNPYPISEKQRLDYSPELDVSLEKIYPEIYKKLLDVANLLVLKNKYQHQEIEFTFESSRPEDVYILQTRPISLEQQPDIPVFAYPEEVQKDVIARGVGVSGGAMSGLVVFTKEDIESLRQAKPDNKIILLRPDTVPEDISLVLAVDGLLTGRGGVTSHASVTAKRVGKTCVVNCSEMFVSETNKYARIGNHELKPGDVISIDGHSGFVVAGSHEIKDSKELFLQF